MHRWDVVLVLCVLAEDVSNNVGGRHCEGYHAVLQNIVWYTNMCYIGIMQDVIHTVA